ncbi:rhamnulokinase [Jeotgalibaca caeni]|uniref:rhamnulokinase n=1 Tax=Jeotgalibaca caeni TaxID=3028623 RepID=UPI00237E6ADE|nr:rhamnulokinase [Jeotgalibaca caeni]MDE1549786.1 rhamnulokinase [Jeotgalibaca caeni]
MNCYAAVDIGASSGRVLLGTYQDGRIDLAEIHRFKNGFFRKGFLDVWDTDYLLKEILTGLAKIKQAGIDTCTLGIDTWAVDYCLLDGEGQPIHDVVSYRDHRTDGAIDKVAELISKETIYQKTGIQFQPFNTLFQLFVEKQEDLERTETILMVPDYLTYRLTGEKVLEKTNASSMQLVNLETGELDEELLALVGLNRKQFPPLIEAGTVVGSLKQEFFPEFDLPEVEVIAVGTHDTASAVAGTPGEGDNWAYLSSGTWSLLGMEMEEPISTTAAYQENYTNEGGVYDTYRFLKNIMGMWLIQEVSRMLDHRYTFAELAQLAAEVEPFQREIDVNHPRFLNPEHMIEEIQAYCQETGQSIPETPGEIVRCVYDSLALCYQRELQKLAELTGKEVEELIIVGGGGNVALLNQTVADLTGMTVWAGPSEATAVGNIVVQMIQKGEFTDLAEARKVIKNTYPMKKFESNNNEYGGRKNV